jgi:hypothetical protein
MKEWRQVEVEKSQGDCNVLQPVGRTSSVLLGKKEVGSREREARRERGLGYCG